MRAEDLIATYVSLRDRIAEIKKDQAAHLKPFTDGLADLEGLLGEKLEETGADSLKTKAGTVFKSSWSSAKVTDWAEVLDYAIEHERFDLFERRVSKTIVEEIGAVPGVTVERGTRVSVRRA